MDAFFGAEAEEPPDEDEAEAEEYNRATAAEADLTNAMIDWDDLIQALRARLTKEEAYKVSSSSTP